MRNLLNVIADILTLLALVVAGVGHMLPWLDSRWPYAPPIRVDDFFREHGPVDWKDQERFRLEREKAELKLRKDREDRDRARAVEYMDFQAWHASRSGVALGVLLVLVCLSIAISWGPGFRRLLVLLMFGSALTALIFETLIFTQYPITEWHAHYAGNLRPDGGFITAIVGTSCAAFFSLVRMLWTMPPIRVRAAEPPVVPAAPIARPIGESSPSGFVPHRELNH